MMVGKAQELTLAQLRTELVVLQYPPFLAIEAASRALAACMGRLCGARVTPLSCDEAFVDVTGLLSAPLEAGGASAGGATSAAAAASATARLLLLPPEVGFLRAAVLAETGIVVSVGLGSTPLLARLATRRAKPNGAYAAPDGEGPVAEFLRELKVSALPGVGRVLAEKLEAEGIVTVPQLSARSLGDLQALCGPASGAMLYDAARGVGEGAEPPAPPRTISVSCNYGIRFTSVGLVSPDAFMGKLAAELAARLAESEGGKRGGGSGSGSGSGAASVSFSHCGLAARTLTLTIMRAGENWKAKKHNGHGWPVIEKSFQQKWLSAVHQPAMLQQAAVRLLHSSGIPMTELRGLALSASDLCPVHAGGAQRDISALFAASAAAGLLVARTGAAEEGAGSVSEGGMGSSTEDDDAVFEVVGGVAKKLARRDASAAGSPCPSSPARPSKQQKMDCFVARTSPAQLTALVTAAERRAQHALYASFKLPVREAGGEGGGGRERGDQNHSGEDDDIVEVPDPPPPPQPLLLRDCEVAAALDASLRAWLASGGGGGGAAAAPTMEQVAALKQAAEACVKGAEAGRGPLPSATLLLRALRRLLPTNGPWGEVAQEVAVFAEAAHLDWHGAQLTWQ